MSISSPWYRMCLCVLASGLCLLIGIDAPSVAQEVPIPFDARSARVQPMIPGAMVLTPPTDAPAPEVVRGFLADRHDRRTLESLTLTAEFDMNRRTYVRMKQQVGGLEVYGTYVKAAVNEDGELVHVVENLQPPPRGILPPAVVGPAGALAVALAENHPGRRPNLAVVGSDGPTTQFEKNGFFWTEPRVTRVAVPFQGGAMREGFLVETWEAESNLLYHTLVSGNGRVLGVELRTNTDSYNIFPDHPGNSTQTIVAGPGTGNTESPLGWLAPLDHSSIFITGNNTETYLDTDTSNSPDSTRPDGTSPDVISDGNFVAVVDLNQEPETGLNPDAAVQNFFYYCNAIHDKLYSHGFVESAGNFQNNNFGNGGAGGDAVLCEAQDGSGTDNANFSTPSDGSSGRMQMFLWTSPQRDGALDSDLVWHEYGHGLTWRMIGSMSGPMSGAVGEGMSDALAIVINDDDVLAEYSFNNPLGIRSEPYTNYTRTYGDFDGVSVHFDGEIYAAIIWDLWQLFKANGFSKDLLLTYLVDGMNFTPAGPAFEDMRDGILQAADPSHYCLVWESFARFGVGVNAQGSVSGNGPFGGGEVSIIEDFAVDEQCNTGDNCSDGWLANGNCFAKCDCADGSRLYCEDNNICLSNLTWIACGNITRKACP